MVGQIWIAQMFLVRVLAVPDAQVNSQDMESRLSRHSFESREGGDRIGVLVSRNSLQITIPLPKEPADRVNPLVSGWWVGVKGVRAPFSIHILLPVKDSTISYREIRSLRDSLRTFLSRSYGHWHGLPVSGRVSLEMTDDALVITSDDPMLIHEFFGLRPDSISVSTPFASQSGSSWLSKGVITYMDPQIPEPTEEVRAYSRLRHREVEARYRTYHRGFAIDGVHTQDSTKVVTVGVGVSLDLLVQEWQSRRCIASTMGFGFVSDSAWSVSDPSVVRVDDTSIRNRGFEKGLLMARLTGLRPGRVTVRIPGIRSVSDTMPRVEASPSELRLEVRVE